MSKNMNKPSSSPMPAIQQPKAIQVVAPLQPKVTPATSIQQPKTTQQLAPQPIRDIPRTTRPTPTTAPTHDDIAKRAYEIYAEKGDRQDDSEQNWKQAEHELKN